MPTLSETIRLMPHINVIETFITNPNFLYDRFMNYCSDHGIYVLVSIIGGYMPVISPALVPCEFIGGDSDDPGCYNPCLLSFGQAVVNLFSQFDNTLAFKIDDTVETGLLQCVKAYTRDIKLYQRQCGFRLIPISFTVQAGFVSQGDEYGEVIYNDLVGDILISVRNYVACNSIASTSSLSPQSGDALIATSNAIDMMAIDVSAAYCPDTYNQLASVIPPIHSVPTYISNYGACGPSRLNWNVTEWIYNPLNSVVDGGIPSLFIPDSNFSTAIRICTTGVEGSGCTPEQLSAYEAMLQSTMSFFTNIPLSATRSTPNPPAVCGTTLPVSQHTLTTFTVLDVPASPAASSDYEYVQCPTGGNTNYLSNPYYQYVATQPGFAWPTSMADAPAATGYPHSVVSTANTGMTLFDRTTIMLLSNAVSIACTLLLFTSSIL